MISVNNQIFSNFVIEYPLRLWRLHWSASMGMCSIKNVSWSKKPHPNRMTQKNAGAAQLLKKLIQTKIPRVVFFRAARDNEWNEKEPEEKGNDFASFYLKMNKKYAFQHINRIVFSRGTRLWHPKWCAQKARTISQKKLFFKAGFLDFSA